jgi:hypothetical protein
MIHEFCFLNILTIKLEIIEMKKKSYLLDSLGERQFLKCIFKQRKTKSRNH